MDIEELLVFSVKNKASDLHLSAGVAPKIRVDGDLCSTDFPVQEHQDVLKMLFEIMNEQQQKNYREFLETDFSFELKGLARFRVNIFNQSRGAAAVFRIIPLSVLTVDDLKLPSAIREIATSSRGLVLFTGPTGSGKSTSLAAIIDYINTTRCQHILTVEDPVEFIHCSKKSLVNQREVYKDTLSFNAALRSALRENPDVILVGELRDLETIRLALTAAETGHLVLATLHTHSASKTINRITGVFPVEEQEPVRQMLSESLQAVVAQTLLKKNQEGRVAAFEIMRCTAAIRNLIREDKVAQIDSYIQTGESKGMHTLDQHLTHLVNQNIISHKIAYEAAVNKMLFNAFL